MSGDLDGVPQTVTDEQWAAVQRAQLEAGSGSGWERLSAERLQRAQRDFS